MKSEKKLEGQFSILAYKNYCLETSFNFNFLKMVFILFWNKKQKSSYKLGPTGLATWVFFFFFSLFYFIWNHALCYFPNWHIIIIIIYLTWSNYFKQLFLIFSSIWVTFIFKHIFSFWILHNNYKPNKFHNFFHNC